MVELVQILFTSKEQFYIYSVDIFYFFRGYSLFQYEAANGRLSHYFSGAKKVSTQIVQQAIIHQEVLTTSQ